MKLSFKVFQLPEVGLLCMLCVYNSLYVYLSDKYYSSKMLLSKLLREVDWSNQFNVSLCQLEQTKSFFLGFSALCLQLHCIPLCLHAAHADDRPIYTAANIIGKMFALIRGLPLLHCLPGTMQSHNFVWCAYFDLGCTHIPLRFIPRHYTTSVINPY